MMSRVEGDYDPARLPPGSDEPYIRRYVCPRCALVVHHPIVPEVFVLLTALLQRPFYGRMEPKVFAIDLTNDELIALRKLRRREAKQRQLDDRHE